ncbi:hypothetical protein M406DRAFT_72701 [Cryphonectria parasitica EP155]|uniref:Uncharacterized protein n=1 Tax=Cryphonectria parasitica (strain ATCC 38755 / EP155) TaxID=660469 RepID=A0A9P4XXH3_CRYP1|nr:uncharacterized protein M406DRAFT_72701 [Cryphonectria parasitica EP155]KAF3762719.1 hypothetical protein M406DRAFT_72701 [Cryphonectria parasitica EP155]
MTHSGMLQGYRKVLQMFKPFQGNDQEGLIHNMKPPKRLGKQVSRANEGYSHIETHTKSFGQMLKRRPAVANLRQLLFEHNPKRGIAYSSPSEKKLLLDGEDDNGWSDGTYSDGMSSLQFPFTKDSFRPKEASHMRPSTSPERAKPHYTDCMECGKLFLDDQQTFLMECAGCRKPFLERQRGYRDCARCGKPIQDEQNIDGGTSTTTMPYRNMEEIMDTYGALPEMNGWFEDTEIYAAYSMNDQEEHMNDAIVEDENHLSVVSRRAHDEHEASQRPISNASQFSFSLSSSYNAEAYNGQVYTAAEVKVVHIHRNSNVEVVRTHSSKNSGTDWPLRNADIEDRQVRSIS